MFSKLPVGPQKSPESSGLFVSYSFMWHGWFLLDVAGFCSVAFEDRASSLSLSLFLVCIAFLAEVISSDVFESIDRRKNLSLSVLSVCSSVVANP